MVRIVHTADVHLTPSAPERLDALDAVLSIAEEYDADAVTIGGDLFDSDVAAEDMRPTLREHFSGCPCPVYAIPGNHDRAAFAGDRYFGEDFIPLLEDPYSQVTIDTLRVTAIPYTNRMSDELLLALRDRTPHDGPEALLLHCSLEAPIHRDAGDEDTTRYCPVTKSTLATLDFDFYLAGHYHSPNLLDIGVNQQFVYPGTPASTTWTETGSRTLAVLKTESAATITLPELETFHYLDEEFSVRPGEEQAILEELESFAAKAQPNHVKARAEVTGLINWDEATFANELTSIEDLVTVQNTTRTVETVTAHPLWTPITERLDSLDAETRDAVEYLILECMASADAEGKLR